MSGVDFVFNISKGRPVQQHITSATIWGVMVLKAGAVETDSGLVTRTTIADILTASTEVANTGYTAGGKTALTSTLTATVGTFPSGHNDLSIPNQTWTAIAAGDNWAKLIVYYNSPGANSARIPVTAHTFDVTTDGSDITVQFNASGFYRAT